MNKRRFFFLLGHVCLTLVACSDEGRDVTRPGRISLALHVGDTGSLPEGRVADGRKPAKALISIETAAGTIVHDLTELTLLNFGDDLVSEDLELVAGTYRSQNFW